MIKTNGAHEAQSQNADTAEDSSVSKKRKIVIPGEIIVSGEDFLPSDGAKRIGNDIVASKFGLAEEAGRVIKVISITGAFIPRRNNVVIGRVTNITMNGWVLDIDSAQSGFLPIDASPHFINKNEMDQFLCIGDVIVAKIWSINQRGVDLSLDGNGLGKLEQGFLFRVSPNRVPRVIGREGSMINLIKEKTNCDITVGQNGWIWICGSTMDDEIKARKAVEFVTDKVYVEGLTEKMETWFQENQ
ncbi:MAG: KH domain-containing protein [Nanoarchaeota archaeon]